MKVILKDLAFGARSGDKGDISNIGVIAKDEKSYELIKKHVTPQKIRTLFHDQVKGEIEIYEMPNILALEIVLRNALDGGATKTLRFDQTGKSMSTALLRMELEI